MGLVYSTIKLSNPLKPNQKPLEVKCSVDSGSTYLCVPQHIALQLGIETTETREATLANGSNELVPYAGPVKVAFENRSCFVGSLILGNEVLLGAVPMEDMDLVVHPATQKLMTNPLHPNKPSYTIK